MSDEWVCGCDHVLCVSAVALEEDSHDERARAVAREIKRRTKAVGAFPDRASALRLITAVALKVTTKWSDRRYVDVSCSITRRWIRQRDERAEELAQILLHTTRDLTPNGSAHHLRRDDTVAASPMVTLYQAHRLALTPTSSPLVSSQ